MLPKHHFSKKRKGNRHVSGSGGAVDRKGGVLRMQGRKSLGHNNFLVDTSMQAYISIYLPLVCIVQGFLRSLFLVNIKQRTALSLLNSIWFWILDITEVRPLPSSWLDSQKNTALEISLEFRVHLETITAVGFLPTHLPSPFFLCRFPSILYLLSQFSCFLSLSPVFCHF